MTPEMKDQLRKVSESYFQALRDKNFSAIPFSDDIVLRAPLAPGGSLHPVKGKAATYELWWKPLEPALDGARITVIDHYYHESLREMVTKAEFYIAAMDATLRVADRFVINDKGEITEQENHFDASPLKSYIHHIALRSTDFERTINFYQRILGFPLAINTPELIIFVAGSVFLAFKKAAPRSDAYTVFSPFEVGLDHIAITCEQEVDLYAFAKKLTDAQVENTGVKLDTVLQKKYVAFKDPDRIQWEYYMK